MTLQITLKLKAGSYILYHHLAACMYVYVSKSDQNVLVMFVMSLTVKDWPPSEPKFLETMQILTSDVCTVVDSYLFGVAVGLLVILSTS